MYKRNAYQRNLGENVGWLASAAKLAWRKYQPSSCGWLAQWLSWAAGNVSYVL